MMNFDNTGDVDVTGMGYPNSNGQLDQRISPPKLVSRSDMLRAIAECSDQARRWEAARVALVAKFNEVPD